MPKYRLARVHGLQSPRVQPQPFCLKVAAGWTADPPPKGKFSRISQGYRSERMGRPVKALNATTDIYPGKPAVDFLFVPEITIDTASDRSRNGDHSTGLPPKYQGLAETNMRQGLRHPTGWDSSPNKTLRVGGVILLRKATYWAGLPQVYYERKPTAASHIIRNC
jgi:hypothetical protein